MQEPISDDSFIVISGHHPQKGKRDRLSRVRAHITNRHFRKLQHKQKIKAEQTHTAQSPATVSETNQQYRRQDAGHLRIGNGLPNSMHLLGPFSFTAETTRRVQKFFDLYLRGYINSHPFYHNVIRWAMSEPHFMSAKLLNASGWDDVLESGELTLWTVRQRFITIRLLRDALTNEVWRKDKYSTIAAIQALLAFELLIGNNQNIHRLTSLYESLISNSIEPNNVVWIFLTRGHYMLSCADRLRKAGDNNNCHDHTSGSPPVVDQDTGLDPNSEYQFASPVDLSLFTLSQPSLADRHSISDLLCDLYHILSIATSSQATALSRPTYEYVVSRHNQLISYISNHGHPNTSQFLPISSSTVANDPHLTALRLCTLILTSYLLSSHYKTKEDQTKNLTNLVSQLRALLNSSASELHNRVGWLPFPGALVWCHAIGLRFADSRRDRTWFLMEFLRVAHLCILETWEKTSKSMEVIVCGLVRIERVSMEPRECLNN